MNFNSIFYFGLKKKVNPASNSEDQTGAAWLEWSNTILCMQASSQESNQK